MSKASQCSFDGARAQCPDPPSCSLLPSMMPEHRGDKLCPLGKKKQLTPEEVQRLVAPTVELL